MDALGRQAVWSLSNGVFVLAFGGLFWTTLGLGLGVRVVAASETPLLFALLALLNPAIFAGVVAGAFYVRRRAPGFKRSEILQADRRIRDASKRVVRGFGWVVLGEALLIAITGFLAFQLRRPELAWPLIGLIVGIHFVPLGWLFRVPTYYATGIASALICLAALGMFDGPKQTLFLGYGLGAVAWLSAAHITWRVDEFAERWADATASQTVEQRHVADADHSHRPASAPPRRR